jgi:hypothetical protein
MAVSIPENQKTEIKNRLRNIENDTSEPSPSTRAQIGSVADFCRLWPEAKLALEFLLSLDVTPAPVKAAIGLVIKAGDVISGIICR